MQLGVPGEVPRRYEQQAHAAVGARGVLKIEILAHGDAGAVERERAGTGREPGLDAGDHK